MFTWARFTFACCNIWLSVDCETDCREYRTWMDTTSFFACPLCFFPHSFSSSYFFPLFHCLISLLLFGACSLAQVFGKTLVHDFAIFYSHMPYWMELALYEHQNSCVGDVPAIKQLNTNKQDCSVDFETDRHDRIYFFCVHCTFQIHWISFSYSYVLLLFHCLISIFLFPCANVRRTKAFLSSRPGSEACALWCSGVTQCG